MAIAAKRDRPFSQFNFTVDLGDKTTEKPEGGFQEVSGLGMEVTIAEYRAGNKRDTSSTDKIPTRYKVPDVTLKRGVLGADNLYSWLDDARKGKPERRTVTISLYSEDGGEVVQSWVLYETFPIKYTGPSLSGKGTDVAVEELVLACERIDMKFA